MSASRRPSAGGFKTFLTKTNALALAIGVVLGAAAGAVVNSLVNDVIMPPIGQLLGGTDFSDLKIILTPATGGDPTTEVAIRYGSFINSVISFVIIALVVYIIGTMLIREEAAAPTKECPFCREANHVDASKCKACASAI